MTIIEALRKAAICEWCGAKLWPPEQMESHLMIHEVRYLFHASEAKVVQETFERMRDLPWASSEDQ